MQSKRGERRVSQGRRVGDGAGRRPWSQSEWGVRGYGQAEGEEVWTENEGG